MMPAQVVTATVAVSADPSAQPNDLRNQFIARQVVKIVIHFDHQLWQHDSGRTVAAQNGSQRIVDKESRDRMVKPRTPCWVYHFLENVLGRAKRQCRWARFVGPEHPSPPSDAPGRRWSLWGSKDHDDCPDGPRRPLLRNLDPQQSVLAHHE